MERSRCYSQAEVDHLNQWRLLWEQHIAWTRMVIMGIVSDLPDLAPITVHLLENPANMARALEPFYGPAVASEFERLLREHLVIAGELVKAAKAGDNAKVIAERVKWYVNADAISAFLARINPFWSKQKWLALFDSHLAMTEDEAVTMLTQKYSESISLMMPSNGKP